ncbi:hypothetical protein L1049_016060 [Liquidambar formosana]|uniref:Glutaredoxin domain-containing protein n=1 Tax=Liquidambar formosana TaxID=63359 RepID=A0AAP0RZZ9_LIQFO
MEEVTKLVAQRPLVIFSRTHCFMSHSIMTLFREFGADPAVHELDQIPEGRDIEQALTSLGRDPIVPTVYIGGELVGGANEVMSLHLNRTLIPWLKRVNAIWV